VSELVPHVYKLLLVHPSIRRSEFVEADQNIAELVIVVMIGSPGTQSPGCAVLRSTRACDLVILEIAALALYSSDMRLGAEIPSNPPADRAVPAPSRYFPTLNRKWQISPSRTT
jgi:hypothetical protein